MYIQNEGRSALIPRKLFLSRAHFPQLLQTQTLRFPRAPQLDSKTQLRLHLPPGQQPIEYSLLPPYPIRSLSLHHVPPPKAGTAGSLGPDFGMWAGGAFDVTGHSSCGSKASSHSLRHRTNEGLGSESDGLGSWPMKKGRLGGPSNQIATRIHFYGRGRCAQSRCGGSPENSTRI